MFVAVSCQGASKDSGVTVNALFKNILDALSSEPFQLKPTLLYGYLVLGSLSAFQ